MDGIIQKRQAAKTVDINTFSTNVNISTDPVSERRRQIALQVSMLYVCQIKILRVGDYEKFESSKSDKKLRYLSLKSE